MHDYELTGMVVSYRQHDGETSRMHRQANDHLNMADLCVVWGDTARSRYLDRLEFWNGVFTCNVHTSNSAAWARYGSGGSKRGTSTTRDDTGDGACETIFIDEFEIVQEAVSYWRLAMYCALALMAVTLVRHFRRPYRPYDG